ncbi:uncharacterized protein MEPE_05414 [Melanopsichium pennsylvanicum]|uniref:Uncharacterized protein n=1 Tax=Melanopsichium pennsylvanicum TaxID=63383 RepID=A0AAJ4XQ30_9BASI|nr:uncharacterized protein MEPE_05414 [Melanopsichium pennsylvanicum]
MNDGEEKGFQGVGGERREKDAKGSKMVGQCSLVRVQGGEMKRWGDVVCRVLDTTMFEIEEVDEMLDKKEMDFGNKD